MGSFTVSVSKLISSPPEKLYRLIADYRNGHPLIVPEAYFSSLEVEDGPGTGAGTIIRFNMHVMGRTLHCRSAISEPEPGRVLVEKDLAERAVTTFIVDSQNGGKSANVTITTEMKTRDGILGAIERFITSRFLKKVYIQELKQLSNVAQGVAARVSRSN